MIVKCDRCGAEIARKPSRIRTRNFCSNKCRCAWFTEYTLKNTNIPGHSAGHKAPHLSEYNRTKNPMNTSEGWSEDRRKRQSSINKERVGECGENTYPKDCGRHEHRRVAEATLGRPLKKGEVVHHVNGNKHDNRPENLMIMTQSEHAKLHARLKQGVI